jgi:hypothetical protein
MPKNDTVRGRYWYHVTLYECPVCGATDEVRERRYTKRPDDWDKRHAFEYLYCLCLL